MLKSLRQLTAAAALIAATSSVAHAQTTEDVWNHHIAAWDAQDAAAVAADYTDASVLILNNQVFRGQAAIKSVFDQLFTLFAAGQNHIDPAVVEGRVVYITWHFTPVGEAEAFGSDSFVIENGKIAVQTIASPLYQTHPVLSPRD